ncbi:hypothetical protein JCM33374_g1274 [Metschnikowia sp. JCM 33374]|nr:hypothetical protein JCM33374_g1274 [Metschnikowia sp. JCM 33374]
MAENNFQSSKEPILGPSNGDYSSSAPLMDLTAIDGHYAHAVPGPPSATNWDESQHIFPQIPQGFPLQNMPLAPSSLEYHSNVPTSDFEGLQGLLPGPTSVPGYLLPSENGTGSFFEQNTNSSGIFPSMDTPNSEQTVTENVPSHEMSTRSLFGDGNIAYPTPENQHTPEYPNFKVAHPNFSNSPSQLPGNTSWVHTMHPINSDTLSLPVHMNQYENSSSHEIYRTLNQSPLPVTDQPNESNLGATISENKIIQEAEEAFDKFAPLLSTVSTQNFCVFLVECLRDYHQYIPLSDLFNLIYVNKGFDYEFSSVAQISPHETTESLELKLKSLKFCSVILKTFQSPLPQKGVEVLSNGGVRLSSASFHEFLRCFLGIKIIFSSIQKVDDSSVSHLVISRQSVYKLYYILCQRLLRSHPSIEPGISQHLILGPSKLGQLTNLVYPNIRTKRLGRRGDSKPHFIGYTWKESVLDSEILQLLELELPQLKEHFNQTPRKAEEPKSVKRAKTSHGVSESKSISDEPQSMVSGSSVFSKPIYSCVDLSYRFPESDCSPRDWKTTPNSIPSQSKWAYESMKKSLVALKVYNIDMNPLIENIKNGKFGADEMNSIPQAVFDATKTLSDVSAPNKAYLHLCLVVLLLLFPIIIASDEEVPSASKIQLRNSVKACVAKLQYERSSLVSIDRVGLETFTNILSKMVKLNEMTSCRVEVEYGERVLKEMVGDLEIAGRVSPESFTGKSPLEETYITSIVLAMNAYNFKIVEENTQTAQQDIIATISSLATTLQKTVMSTNRDMKMISPHAIQGLEHKVLDVPYEVFKLAVRDFHQITLKESAVLKLPMSLISFIMLHKSNAMQYSSFQDFGKRDPKLSRESFKCWWVFSSMYQEYMSMIAEVVALSKTLEISDLA